MRKVHLALAILSACVLFAAGCGRRGGSQPSADDTPLPSVDASAVADTVEVVSFEADPNDKTWAILKLKVKQDWSGRPLVCEIGSEHAIPVAEEGKAGQTIDRPLEYFLFKGAPSVQLVWK